jgi:hypothetical protein
MPRFGLPLPPLHFLPWAAARPHMRRLTLGLSHDWPLESREAQTDLDALTAAAAQVQRSSPGLTIRIVPGDELHPEEQGLAWDPFA